MTTNPDLNEKGADARQSGGVLPRRDLGTLPAEEYRAYLGANIHKERNLQRRQLGEKLQDVEQRIEASDGYRIYNKTSLLEKSYFIFDVNRINLEHALEEFEQPTVFWRLWEERSRARLDLFINDVIRLFHNYLAGATALLDQLHLLQGGLSEETNFSDEYQTRHHQQFGDSPLPRFLDDLLAHMLREGLPFALAEMGFGRTGGDVEINSAIRLDVGKLGEWDGWSELSRAHLETLGNVRLADIVEEHATLVIEFYRWFVSRQSELHNQALEELQGLEEERQLLQEEIGRLEDSLEAAEKTAVNMQEEREKLAKELSTERQYRVWERERVEKLEEYLERERSKGFWGRLRGR